MAKVIPDSIQAPAGEELILMTRATGFQIYVCRLRGRVRGLSQLFVAKYLDTRRAKKSSLAGETELQRSKD